MKRLFNIVLFALAVSALSAQGLRQSVCFVRPQYTDAERAALHEYVLWLSRVERSDEARYLRSSLQSEWYGTGVLVLKGEQPCVVTYRSMVGYARKATVAFYQHDGRVVYNDCKVLGTDGSMLALIELPTDCTQHPLPIAQTLPEDGEDIFAAGFPMLDKKPQWQLVPGTVSNAWLELDGYTFIQHSVVTDFGASGGALLVKKDGNYQLAGINVSMMTTREGIGLAVPSDIISQLLSAETLSMDADKVAELAETERDQWIELFRLLPDSVQQQRVVLPLDLILNTKDIKLDKKAKKKNIKVKIGY